jgi:hypothetical protein
VDASKLESLIILVKALEKEYEAVMDSGGGSHMVRLSLAAAAGNLIDAQYWLALEGKLVKKV